MLKSNGEDLWVNHFFSQFESLHSPVRQSKKRQKNLTFFDKKESG